MGNNKVLGRRARALLWFRIPDLQRVAFMPICERTYRSISSKLSGNKSKVMICEEGTYSYYCHQIFRDKVFVHPNPLIALIRTYIKVYFISINYVLGDILHERTELTNKITQSRTHKGGCPTNT